MPIATEGLTDAATHPAVVWTAVAAACIVVILLAFARVAEPVAGAWGKLREARQKGEDARIQDLSSQVDHLAGRVYTLEQRQQRQDAYLYAHAVWDQRMLDAAIRSGLDLEDIGPPPPLRPPLDAP
jgi:hypothetical protein